VDRESGEAPCHGPSLEGPGYHRQNSSSSALQRQNAPARNRAIPGRRGPCYTTGPVGGLSAPAPQGGAGSCAEDWRLFLIVLAAATANAQAPSSFSSGRAGQALTYRVEQTTQATEVVGEGQDGDKDSPQPDQALAS